jgi:hypothetical protein
MAAPDSIFVKPAAIALLANNQAIDDLNLFLQSLLVWEEAPPPLYIYASEAVKLWIHIHWKPNYPSSIHIQTALHPYENLTRQMMEQTQSKKGLSNLFHDFTQEKCDLVEWALQCLPEFDKARGVLFCDADIFWLSGLPSIHQGKTLGLSPHMIRKHDENLYGTYNAGILWTNNLQMPSIWREACKHSRFFEQAALEEVRARTAGDEVVEFEAQINYGWWRLYQSSTPLEEQKKRWSLFRNTSGLHSGLCLDGQPVCCIHTHWKTNDFVTQSFNKFIAEKLKLLSSQPKTRKLLNILKIKY